MESRMYDYPPSGQGLYGPHEIRPILSLQQPPAPARRLRLYFVFFLLTGLSTFATVGLTELLDPKVLADGFGPALAHAAIRGLWYAVPLMTILLCHESGHFLMCRRYGVPATLPFFIPCPFISPFGTLGALIKMRGYMPNRRAIFDIGIAGPLAGFVVCLPCIAWGIHLSEIALIPASPTAGQIFLGEPLIFKALAHLIRGPLPEHTDLMLHPLGFAGWAGLFVTGLNLIPLGQLDGGHILYGLLGRRANGLYRLGVALFLGAAILWNRNFLLIGILLLFVGRSHPAPLDPVSPLGKRRAALGILALAIFVGSFTFTPLIVSN